MLLLLLLLVCDMTDLWIFIRCHPVVAICIFWFEWSWVSQVMCIYMYIFIFWHFKWGPQLLAFLSIYSSMGTNIFQKTRLKLCFRPQRIKVWLKCTWVCYYFIDTYCVPIQRLHPTEVAFEDPMCYTGTAKAVSIRKRLEMRPSFSRLWKLQQTDLLWPGLSQVSLHADDNRTFLERKPPQLKPCSAGRRGPSVEITMICDF